MLFGCVVKVQVSVLPVLLEDGNGAAYPMDALGGRIWIYASWRMMSPNRPETVLCITFSTAIPMIP
jgi:hypothetical protein